MKKAFLIIAALLLAVVGLWDTMYPSGTWRYKMTVEVETPEGVKTGSAVREVTVISVPQFLPEVRPTVKLKGEAVVVDLGERGVLFALLNGYKFEAASLPFYVFPSGKGGTTKEGIKYYKNLKAGPVHLEPAQYPKFVYFKDLNDPKTVGLVLEMKSCADPKTGVRNTTVCIEADHFEEVYGEGVHLKSVQIEMTREPVTSTIKQKLKWLPSYYNQMLDGSRNNFINAPNKLANSLASGAFLAGDNK